MSSKSEYFNDFWTSCDWSNDAENSALITGINYILKYILNIKNISQYYCFCCILDQTNTGLVNRRDFFKKIIKKSYCSKTFEWYCISYIYILYGGGGPPGPTNARADFLSQSSPGGESTCYSLPPTYNPCRTWDSNPRPSGYKSNSLSIRPRLPFETYTVFMLFVHCTFEDWM